MYVNVYRYVYVYALTLGGLPTSSQRGHIRPHILKLPELGHVTSRWRPHEADVLERLPHGFFLLLRQLSLAVLDSGVGPHTQVLACPCFLCGRRW